MTTSKCAVAKVPVKRERSHQSYNKTKFSESSSSLGSIASVLTSSSFCLGRNQESLSDLFRDDDDSFQVFMASIRDLNEESQRKRSNWATAPSPSHATSVKTVFSLIDDHTESEDCSEDLDQSLANFLATLSDMKSKELMAYVQQQAMNDEARRLDILHHRITSSFTNRSRSSDVFLDKETSASNDERILRDLPPKSPTRGATEQEEEQQRCKISSSTKDAFQNCKSPRPARRHSVCGTTNNAVDCWSPVKTSSIQGTDFRSKEDTTSPGKDPRYYRRHSIVATTSPSHHSFLSPGNKNSKSLPGRSPRRHSIVTSAFPSQSPFCSPGGQKSKKFVLSPVIRTPRKTIRNTTSPMRRLRQVPCREGLAALPFDDDIKKRKSTPNKCYCPSVSNCVAEGCNRGRQTDMTPRRPLRNRSLSPSKS